MALPPKGADGTQEARNLLAALAYLFPLGLIVWLYERQRPDYFLRYHATQALLLNAASLGVFLVPLLLTLIIPLQPLAVWPLGLHLLLGLGITLLVLFIFAVYCYCVVQAYLGRNSSKPRR